MRFGLTVASIVAVLVWTGCDGSTPSREPTFALTPATEALPTTPSTPAALGSTPTRNTSTSPPPAATAAPGDPPSIEFEPDLREVNPGGSFKVNVVVDPMGRGVSGVQVRLEYDPQVLRAFGASPGPLLGESPAEAGPVVDAPPGTLDYAAARLGATTSPTSRGIFATFDFQVQSSARQGTVTTIRITRVKMPDQSIVEIPGVRVGHGLTVKISR